jgi:hypothetical protein
MAAWRSGYRGAGHGIGESGVTAAIKTRNHQLG